MNCPHSLCTRIQDLSLRLLCSWALAAALMALPASPAGAQVPAVPPAPTGPTGPPSPASVGLLPTNYIVQLSLSPSEVAIINAYVQQRVAELKNPTTMVQGRSRLINSSTTTIQPGPSAAFIQTYESALNSEFTALLPKATKGELRLNIAIIAAKVTANARLANVGSAAMAPVILDLVNDADDSVCLWGMKAAGNVLVPALGNRNNALLAAIVPAVEHHHFRGCIVDEAYDALSPSAADGNPAAQKAMLTELLDLYKKRVALYQSGLPDGLAVDRAPSRYLTGLNYWPLLSNQQQLQTFQCMRDLIDLASQYLVQPNTNAEQRLELTFIIQKTAEAVDVVAGILKDNNLHLNVVPLEHAQPAQIPLLVSPFNDAMKAAFPLPPPPVITQPEEGAEPPASPAEPGK